MDFENKKNEAKAILCKIFEKVGDEDYDDLFEEISYHLVDKDWLLSNMDDPELLVLSMLAWTLFIDFDDGKLEKEVAKLISNINNDSAVLWHAKFITDTIAFAAADRARKFYKEKTNCSQNEADEFRNLVLYGEE